MRRIKIDKTAENFFKKRPPKHQMQLAMAMDSLRTIPEPHDSVEMKNNYPYRRKDVGEYRIIYDYDPLEVRIIVIGKRNDADAYKRFNRM